MHCAVHAMMLLYLLLLLVVMAHAFLPVAPAAPLI
jgi:hypothetical protein